MPLYDYRCRDCGHEFEIQQALSDDTLTVCPECGGDLRKVFSPVGIAFKGSGFYKNDSRGGSSKSSSSSSSGSTSSTSTGSSDTTAADTTPSGSSPSTDSAPAAASSD